MLCTREATFDLKTVETTNSLLLVPEGEVRREEKFLFSRCSDFLLSFFLLFAHFFLSPLSLLSSLSS